MTESGFYTQPSGSIEQGDIFRQDAVCPVADFEQRLLRTVDGAHGSLVLEHGVESYIFQRHELEERLVSAVRTPHHTEPFQPDPDGVLECVIVHASLQSFFIVGTQSCDLTEARRETHAYAVILPVVTLMGWCRESRLPFRSRKHCTIERFLLEEAAASRLSSERDPIAYCESLQTVLAEWNPTRAELREDRNRIKNFLNKSSGWMYRLTPDRAFNVPPAFVDTTATFLVDVEELESRRDSRIARLKSPYREEFAQVFGTVYSRVATPEPPAVPKF